MVPRMSTIESTHGPAILRVRSGSVVVVVPATRARRVLGRVLSVAARRRPSAGPSSRGHAFPADAWNAWHERI